MGSSLARSPGPSAPFLRFRNMWVTHSSSNNRQRAPHTTYFPVIRGCRCRLTTFASWGASTMSVESTRKGAGEVTPPECGPRTRNLIPELEVNLEGAATRSSTASSSVGKAGAWKL
eukprot:scaffold29_cov251-Pinguiococcus_pyrenoidosus.AAC.1